MILHTPTHTLCYPLTETEIYLGLKKLRFGAGKWNGFGGKIQENETVRTAAVRELKEETNLDTKENDLVKTGEISFRYQGVGELHSVTIFITKSFTGTVKESREMRPEKFLISELPYKDMWISDQLWLPDMLEGSVIKGEIYFDEKYVVKDHSLLIVGEWQV